MVAFAGTMITQNDQITKRCTYNLNPVWHQLGFFKKLFVLFIESGFLQKKIWVVMSGY
jgi:hypothetical protein